MMAYSQMPSQENSMHHHGLVELEAVKRIISANLGMKGEVVGATASSDEDKERIVFTRALRWTLQGKKWLNKDENIGKTMEEYMSQKESEYDDKIRSEESIAVSDTLKKERQEFLEACDIIKGALILSAQNEDHTKKE